MYCVLHSVLAAPAVKSRLNFGVRNGMDPYRIAYNIFAFVSLAPILLYQFSIEPEFLFQASMTTRIAGLVIGTTGLVIMTICVSKYFLQLSGLRVESKQPDEQLIVSGVHKWVRHPLYFGTFVFIWGGWIAWPMWSVFVCNVVITIYTLIGIRFEEQKLVGQFGEQYRNYQKRVRKIIPFIY